MIDAERIDGRCTAFDARSRLRQVSLGYPDSDRRVADGLPAGTVIRSVARAREELLHSGVRRGLGARHRGDGPPPAASITSSR